MAKTSSSAKEKTDDPSERRTEWAEDRTLLAKERTFSSWIGMGLGMVGVAIGMQAVFGEADPVWPAKAVASGFLAIAVGIYWAAWRSACRTKAALNDSDADAQPRRAYSLIAATAAVATFGVGAVLWAL